MPPGSCRPTDREALGDCSGLGRSCAARHPRRLPRRHARRGEAPRHSARPWVGSAISGTVKLKGLRARTGHLVLPGDPAPPPAMGSLVRRQEDKAVFGELARYAQLGSSVVPPRTPHWGYSPRFHAAGAGPLWAALCIGPPWGPRSEGHGSLGSSLGGTAGAFGCPSLGVGLCTAPG